MGLIFCVLAFGAALFCTLGSQFAGLAVVLTTGYLFGIVRANYLDTFSHFIFDAAVLGFFLGYLSTWWPRKALDPDQEILKRWVVVLLGWVGVMTIIPIQHPLIQLVGLRGNGFLVPFILIGNWLNRDDIIRLALWLSVLNIMAFGFAAAEYAIGVPAFFPRNAVTEIIYRSGDVALTGAKAAFRIPACFGNAHSYGGSMNATLPWLLGMWMQTRVPLWQRVLLACGIVLAMLGVFMCAARTPILLLGGLVAATSYFMTFSGKVRGSLGVVWLILLLGIGYVVSSEERMQRFTTIQDADTILDRLKGSVNMSFLDMLAKYPLGNGMGAGGTSIPYFLQHLVRNPVALENEYCRILLEQGVVGLILWFAFICWCIGHRPRDRRDPWLFGKQLTWIICLANFAVASTGTGLMTSIPQSMLFFLSLGFCTAPYVAPPKRRMPAIPSDAENSRIHAQSISAAKRARL